jgi:hypothetical protein
MDEREERDRKRVPGALRPIRIARGTEKEKEKERERKRDAG